MSSADLVFSQAPALNGDLVFGGDDDAPAIATVTLSAAGKITGLRGSIVLCVGVKMQGAARITGLRGPISMGYDNNVARPTVGQVQNRWQDAGRVSRQALGKYQQAAPLSTGYQNRWQDADRLHQSTRADWQITLPLRQSVATRWQDAAHLHLARTAHWQTAQAMRQAGSIRWQDADRLCQASTQRFQEGLRDRRLSVSTRWQDAGRHVVGVEEVEGYGLPLFHGHSTQWQDAWVPRPGTSTKPQPPLPEPCYLPSAHLLFDTPWSADANLVFICERHAPPEPGATVVVPVRKVYIVINEITLHRVDTGAELNAHSFSMSLDFQSWTWTWQASLHHDAADHLGRDSQGDPAELAIMVNGLLFHMRLERVTRDRRFNPTRWGVSGKGKAAILDAPWAPAMSFSNAAPRTAQQLMADVLTINGVSLGWSIDWRLTDWVVPAGAWAVQGSYMAALNDIATAVGGYVQPHPTDAVLRILPRYPAAPWSWGSITPDFEIPADAAEVEGTEYMDRPEYNRVFVGGVGAGVFGPFTRAGTAGNAIAPQVTHPLITHADAHRQRGLAELSDTGRQEHITLTMQVLPETGVITPGQFVRYLGDKTVMGIVRSASIDWSRPALRQTIRIETHA